MVRQRVALLTDDRIVSLLASRALADDFDVQVFQTTTAGVSEAIVSFAPTLVFLRDVLASGSALDVLQDLRAQPRLADTRFVILSNGGESAEPYLVGGAAAFVTLPFTAEHLRETAVRVAKGKRTILYVEDSRALHRLVVPPLQEEGYEVIEAFDGHEALEQLEHGAQVDLILSDIDMPGMDGLGLCAAVKRDPRFRRIPFVLLTAREGDEAVLAGFSAGADDYLMKPVVVPEMLARVQRFLGERSEQREERVLVVDPDPSAARVVERGLLTHSLGCDLAEDADAARALLETGRYALAIIDCRLAPIDGVALVRQLRDGARTRDLPVIMTSETDSLGEQIRVRSVGPQSFVVKPYPPDRLLAEVERTLANARHKRQVAAMRGYLSEGAIEAIERRTSAGDDEPRAEATFRTIFFLDIVGFTTLCERMAPLAVVRFLNAFFDEVVPVLTRHGGSIDKFVGDCVMALFPRERSGPQRAVTAALEILQRLPVLRTATGIDVHVRVGINAGPVVIGDIGSTHHRRDFTVIGDHVNVAARLQSNAGVDEVYVSDAVAKHLSGEFALTPVGEMPVKGRREPVSAYSVRSDGPIPPSAPASTRTSL
jgi:DNA-binding response OmpR family regulator